MTFVEKCMHYTNLYFVEDEQTALVELLNLATSIFIKHLKNYQISYDDIEDGKQDLALKLINDATKFDVTKNNNFLSFVQKRIHSEAVITIMRSMYPHIHRDNNTFFKCANVLRKNLPTVKYTDKTVNNTKQLMNVQYHYIDDDEESTELSLLVDENYSHLEFKVIYTELKRVIDDLPEKDKKLIYALYFEGKTLKQIGDEENVSHQAIDSRFKRISRTIRDKMLASEKLEKLAIISEFNSDYLETTYF